MASAEQLKQLAPYLDPHILLWFLKKNVPKSEKLQSQLQSRLLSDQDE